MMTLNEAIEHAEWAANNCEGECSEEHHQLAEWLRELRQWKRLAGEVELDDHQVAIFRLYAERIGELIRILDHDWNIEASWDGLRKFWYVGLNESGMAERDKREAQNAKLRELMWDLYCLAYPSTVEWEVSHETYNKYSPCKLCEKTHGGKSPCASTSKDLTEECCKPFQAVVIADRMRDLGIEVDA